MFTRNFLKNLFGVQKKGLKIGILSNDLLKWKLVLNAQLMVSRIIPTAIVHHLCLFPLSAHNGNFCRKKLASKSGVHLLYYFHLLFRRAVGSFVVNAA